MAQPLTSGRIIILLANLAYSVGAFIADFNETHVLNPRWPPHAKFHNGQTMTLGILLASSSLYYLFKAEKDVARVKDNLFTAALLGTFYCGAALCAILYPGTAWQDPEFTTDAQAAGPQRPIFVGVCVAMWVGWWVESSRLTKVKGS